MEPKKPSSQDLEILETLHRSMGKLALMPIVHNDQPRLGLVVLHEEGRDSYVQLLAVLVAPEDKVLDMIGRPASFAPPLN